MTERERSAQRRRMAVVWAAVSALLVIVSWDQIETGLGWGPDDRLRQVQLRDLLAGQSWFDTAQYRVAWPDSAAMHWPRLVELPLALVAQALTPLVGAATAEVVAMVAVPLVALGCAMVLVHSIAARCFDAPVALLAAALVAATVPTVAQLRPMRIDHHGWQVVCALLALRGLVARDQRTGGLAMGAGAALWLAISMEGLPLAVALFGIAAWRWWRDPAEASRLGAAVAAFAGCSVLLHLASWGGFARMAGACDIVAPAHLAAIGAGAVPVVVGTVRNPARPLARLGWLAAAGLSAGATLLLTAPQCAGGAFADLDPLVRGEWLALVKEGTPIWTQTAPQVATLYGGLLVTAVVGLAWLVRRQELFLSNRAMTDAALAFLAAFVVALFVTRATAVAAAFGLPFAAWLVWKAFAFARSRRNAGARVLATAAVVLLILPGPLALAAGNAFERNGKPAPAEESGCREAASVAKLDALREAVILAPFDLGPTILALTGHRALATGHHRNDAAMRDQIEIMTEPVAKARRRLEQRRVAYVVTCPRDAEFANYARRYPEGLAAQVASGKPPDWLQRVYLKGSGLTVYRVAD